MKFLTLSILASSLFVGMPTQNVGVFAQQDDIGLQVVEVQPTAVYTPMGFGENNVAQIGVEGEFPNSCYRLLSIEHKVKKNKIYVKAKALKFQGACLQVVTPWFKLHDLNVLVEGKYEIRHFNNGAEALGTLPVKHSDAKAMVDEQEYAPVSSVRVEYDLDKLPTIVISGYLSNSCLELRDENVDVIATSDRMIEILPKLIYHESPDCETGRWPFKKVLNVPKLQNIPGKYMIYTRVRGNTGIASLEYFFR